MPSDDPVTVWLDQLRAGESAAAKPLFDRYFARLVGLARQRLRDTPRRAADEEDVALSAFDSFCRNAERGKLADLADRDGLWRVLAVFTLRKATHFRRDGGRLKRGGAAGAVGDLELALARDPDPALAAEVAEECERLLAALGEGDLRLIAVLRMEGHSVEEVAARVGCAPRSVKRKLALIRSVWEWEAGHDPG